MVEQPDTMKVDRATGNEAMHVPVRVNVTTRQAAFTLAWEWPFDVVHALKSEDFDYAEKLMSEAAQRCYDTAFLACRPSPEIEHEISIRLGPIAHKLLWERFVKRQASVGNQSWLVPTKAGA
jgi:hypothetical protein